MHYIPRCLHFNDTDKQRAQLYNYLLHHVNNKLTIEKMEALSARDKREKKKIDNDPILSSIGLYEEKKIPEPQKWEFNFKQYLKTEYPDLTINDIPIIIENSIDKVKLYLKSFTEVIRYPILETNKQGERTPNIKKLNSYNQIRREKEVKTFFEAIRLNLIPFSRTILIEDISLRDGKFGTFHYFGQEYISKLFMFSRIQFKFVLETILVTEDQLIQTHLTSNNLLNDLKYSDENLYKLLLQAIDNNAIYFDNESKLHFPCSQNTVSTFFKVNKARNTKINWNLIISNILLRDNSIPASSIKNAPPDPDTTPYTNFMSKIEND